MTQRFLLWSILIVAVGFFGLRAIAAPQPIVWHEKEKTFDADISGIELPDLLKKISTLTGWEVYLEPGTSYSASAKFKNTPRAEALRILLGDLNFEISPQSNSIPKLFVFRTGANKATQRISVEKAKLVLGKDKAILNHLIVTLKPGSSVNIDALAQQLGGKVIGKIDGMNSYLLEFPDEATAAAARKQLAHVDNVASVDSNYLMNLPAPPTMAALQDSAGGPTFALKPGVGGGDGKQIVIGMLDTAVQQLPANMQGFMLPSVSVVGETDPGTALTHGTTIAESILFGLDSARTDGKESSVKILPVTIYKNEPGQTEPSTTTFYVANGIVAAANNGANMISASLGGYGDSPFLQNVADQVISKGIPIFAAAGNEPVTTPVYPAAYPGVVAVTAADRNGTVAAYANRGPFVDVILPGSVIVPYADGSYFVNGTSVSTALASGVAAGLAESTKQAPSKVVPTFISSFAFKP